MAERVTGPNGFRDGACYGAERVLGQSSVPSASLLAPGQDWAGRGAFWAGEVFVFGFMFL